VMSGTKNNIIAAIKTTALCANVTSVLQLDKQGP